jgi:hypothetical protein
MTNNVAAPNAPTAMSTLDDHHVSTILLEAVFWYGEFFLFLHFSFPKSYFLPLFTKPPNKVREFCMLRQAKKRWTRLQF